MPTLHSIDLRTQLHVVSLVDFKKESIRSVARTVGLAKSTLHDNLGKYRAELARFEERRAGNERILMRDVLSLMFEGKTSSRDCAKVLSRIRGEDISHQRVLSILDEVALIARAKNAEKLPLRLASEESAPLAHVSSAAFDEIFQKQSPVLGFVDPVSSFVYLEAADNRSGESWSRFLATLRSLGLHPEATITDGGLGMQKALKDILPNALQCRDLFHVLQKLSKALRALEGYCYRLLAAHYKAQAQQEANSVHIDLALKMEKAIAIYDALDKETKALKSACYFENDTGYVSSSQVEVIIKRIAALIACGERNDIRHDALTAAKTYLSGSLTNIIAYKKRIEEVVSSQFGAVHMETILGYVCPIIEFLDQIQRSYENNERRDYWIKKLLHAREKFRNLSFVDQKEIDLVINQVARIMESLKKSNSIIEAINSVIRRHLVTYKSIPSWFCPLFTFYWNHRTFERGKRKHLKPREILTGKVFEKDWIEVLLDARDLQSTAGSKNNAPKKAHAA
jgi:hypothetical protein